MVNFKQIIQLLVSIIGFIYSFYIIGKLMLFLSIPKTIHNEYQWIINLMDNKSKFDTSLPILVSNSILIIVFILQHSCMKSNFIKNIIKLLKLEILERTIYTVTSSLALDYLMNNWVSIPTIVLWQINVNKHALLYWTFIAIHLFAWTVIYGGSIIMDLPEILGMKQAYYNMKGYSAPIAYKSFELRHLYQHIRHPSFVGFTLILFVTNIMTLDRLLLSTILFIYMYIAWSTDHNDVVYQKCQLNRKQDELRSRVHAY